MYAHCSLTVQSVSSDGQQEQVRVGLDARPVGLSGYFNNVWTQVHCYLNMQYVGDVDDLVVSRNAATIPSTSQTFTITPGVAFVQVCGEATAILKDGTVSTTGTTCS